MTHRFALAAVAMALVACTSKETKTADTAATAAPATPNVVTFTAKDFAFEAPDTVPGGVTQFRLVNQGTTIHHAQIIRFDQGKTLGDLMTALKAGKPTDPLPAWMVPMGGPNPPAPGEETSVFETLEPGNYAVVCFVDLPDHVMHIMKGMSHAFTVVPSLSTAVDPTADVTMTLVDYAFNTSTPLTAGKHMIRMENGAQQAHEMFIAKLDSGKTLKDFETFIEKMKGPPPAHPMGGVAFMLPGAHAFVPIDLTPGNYIMMCFVPDMKDGKPHFMHGMATQIKVT